VSVDEANAAFWDELCGTQLAIQAGATGRDRASLERFDRAYFGFYPYLRAHLDQLEPYGRTLEIGIGYGTVARYLLERGVDYHAIDIAAGPVSMARAALADAGRAVEAAVQGTALDMPYDDQTLDRVVAIGSLHHTGDLPRAIAEVRRVTKLGGRCLVMVYNARSPRRIITTPVLRLAARLLPEERGRQLLNRVSYDANAEGAEAPHTDFSTRAEVRQLFSSWQRVSIESENANAVSLFGRVLVPREWLLSSVGRRAGLDLYVAAEK